MLKKFQWLKGLDLLALILILLTPFLSTTLLVKILFNSDLNHFQLRLSDEIQYWQEINTFKTVGFDGGYYSVQEFISHSSFSHFGIHGPAFAVSMGLLTRIFGWTQTSGPLYNIAFITFGLLLFILLTRPNLKKKLFLLSTVILFYPILIYIPSTMQDSLNQMLALILGGVLIQLSKNEKSSLIIPVLGVILALIAGLLRVYSAVVFFPLIYLLGRRRDKKWFIVSTIISFFIVLLVSALYFYWTSPYPNLFLYELFHLEPMTPRIFITFFAKHFLVNIKDYISLASIMNPMEIMQRYLTIFLSIAMIYFIYKKKTQFVVPLFILDSGVITEIALNAVGRLGDLRLIAPFVIIVLVFFISNLEYKECAVSLSLFLIFCALFFPAFIDNYKNYFNQAHFAINDPKNEDLIPSPALSNIKYQRGSNPWCNSIFTNVIYTPKLLSLQAGIGVNYILNINQVEPPIHSHYLYLSTDLIDKFELTDKVKLIQTEGDLALFVQTSDGCTP